MNYNEEFKNFDGDLEEVEVTDILLTQNKIKPEDIIGEEITLKGSVVTHIYNEKSDQKEYDMYYYKLTDGRIIYSGSESLKRSFNTIISVLERVNLKLAEYPVKITEMKSKNNQGSFYCFSR